MIWKTSAISQTPATCNRNPLPQKGLGSPIYQLYECVGLQRVWFSNSLGGALTPGPCLQHLLVVLFVGDVKDPVALFAKSRGCSPPVLALFQLWMAPVSHSTLIVNCISSLAKSPEQCCKEHLSVT